MVNGQAFRHKTTTSTLSVFLEDSMRRLGKKPEIPGALLRTGKNGLIISDETFQADLRQFMGGKKNFLILYLSKKAVKEAKYGAELSHLLGKIRNCYPLRLDSRIVLISFSAEFKKLAQEHLARAKVLLKNGKSKEAEFMYKIFTEVMVPSYAMKVWMREIENDNFYADSISRMGLRRRLQTFLGSAASRFDGVFKCCSNLLKFSSFEQMKKDFSNIISQYKYARDDFVSVSMIAEYALGIDILRKGADNILSAISTDLKGKRVIAELKIKWEKEVVPQVYLTLSYYKKALDAYHKEQYQEAREWQRKAEELTIRLNGVYTSFYDLVSACAVFESSISSLGKGLKKLESIWKGRGIHKAEKKLAQGFYYSIQRNLSQLSREWKDVNSYSLSFMQSLAREKKLIKDQRFMEINSALASAETLLWRFYTVPAARGYTQLGESEVKKIKNAMEFLLKNIEISLKSESAKKEFRKEISGFLSGLEAMPYGEARRTYLKIMAAFINATVYEAKAKNVPHLFSIIEDIQRKCRKDNIEFTATEKYLIDMVFNGLKSLGWKNEKLKDLKTMLNYNPFHLTERDTHMMASAEYFLTGLRAVLWAKEFPREVKYREVVMDYRAMERWMPSYVRHHMRGLPDEEKVKLYVSHKLDPSKLSKKELAEYSNRVLLAFKFILDSFKLSGEPEYKTKTIRIISRVGYKSKTIKVPKYPVLEQIKKTVSILEKYKEQGKSFNPKYIAQLRMDYEKILPYMQEIFEEKMQSRFYDEVIKEADGSVRKFLLWSLKQFDENAVEISIILAAFSLGMSAVGTAIGRESGRLAIRQFVREMARKGLRPQLTRRLRAAGTRELQMELLSELAISQAGKIGTTAVLKDMAGKGFWNQFRRLIKMKTKKEARRVLMKTAIQRGFHYVINLHAIQGMIQAGVAISMLPVVKTPAGQELFMSQMREGAMKMTLGAMWGTRIISALSALSIPIHTYSLTQRKDLEGAVADTILLGLSFSPIFKLTPVFSKGIQRTLEGRAVVSGPRLKINLQKITELPKTRMRGGMVLELGKAGVYAGAGVPLGAEIGKIYAGMEGSELRIPVNSANFEILREYAQRSSAEDAKTINTILENYFGPYLQVFTYTFKKGRKTYVRPALMFMGSDFDNRYKKAVQEIKRKLNIPSEADIILHIKGKLDKIQSKPTKIR